MIPTVLGVIAPVLAHENSVSPSGAVPMSGQMDRATIVIQPIAALSMTGNVDCDFAAIRGTRLLGHSETIARQCSQHLSLHVFSSLLNRFAGSLSSLGRRVVGNESQCVDNLLQPLGRRHRRCDLAPLRSEGRRLRVAARSQSQMIRQVYRG